MKLEKEFYHLPFRFDVAKLQQEISQFKAADWGKHPQDFANNTAIPLVSVGGEINDSYGTDGQMAATPYLQACPYIQQVMKAFNIPISRSRLMRIAGQAEVPVHRDKYFHWFRRMRVHIPIFTNPQVRFFCNDKSVHMAAGSAWIFDNSQFHWVINESRADRIHLVIDIKGSTDELKILCDSAPRYFPYLVEDTASIAIETYRFEVLTPKEINSLCKNILSSVPELEPQIKQFCRSWQVVFNQFGHSDKGELAYRSLIWRLRRCLQKKELGESGKLACTTLASMLPKPSFSRAQVSSPQRNVALFPDLDACYQIAGEFDLNQHHNFRENQQAEQLFRLRKLFSTPITPTQAWQNLDSSWDLGETKFTLQLQKLMSMGLLKEKITPPEFIRPIFIVAASSSGSSLLCETLSQLEDLWTLGGESCFIEKIPELHPQNYGYASNCLTEKELNPKISRALRQFFTEKLCDREGISYLQFPLKQRPNKLRFLDKTSKNALRIPFLKALFPDALFIYLQREPIASIKSIIDGWRSRKFITYRSLPGWYDWGWSFLLTPGWLSLKGSSVTEIATYQWQTAQDYINQDLEALPSSDWCTVQYADLIANPQQVITQIAEFAGLDPNQNPNNR
ncbi:aspartyl/asparaginyl beta-hydroxylase-like dioxygenase [Xenococcus sp. PCC 7305]|uniref:sulfotransferase n=1 Tax=Xenococcus sp. PCC 7305 TaxID=102125 RepID=UPI0002AC7EF3|nr:sulfotransferase [Xenococcus sp. PCC 7305]ELS05343.1 aspartyl/asparaginyl beta-hydroxylase-like dioxygenase [Xenococcus sp. PCC 7305]